MRTIRWSSFGRSLLFAALAAGGAVAWIAVAAPVIGGSDALALYLVLVTATYLAGLARTLRGQLGVFLASGVGGGALALAAPTLTGEAVGLAILLGGVRSGFLYRRFGARGIATEAVLLTAGLLFARFLASPSLLGVAFPLWGFFLVQSVFFLVRGLRVRRPRPARDPFDEAHARATSLLR